VGHSEFGLSQEKIFEVLLEIHFYLKFEL